MAKGKLSFGLDEEEDGNPISTVTSAAESPRPDTPEGQLSGVVPSAPLHPSDSIEKKRLGPNYQVSVAPKAMTKSAILREAQTREQLRKEFLELQEAVKATEIVVPFVFYDGTNIPGGFCKVRKGDYVWVLLDRSRKVGAELGVGGGEKTNSRREWARVGVDDLMLVRGEVIIPHVSIYVRSALWEDANPVPAALRNLLLHRKQNPRSQQYPSVLLFFYYSSCIKVTLRFAFSVAGA